MLNAWYELVRSDELRQGDLLWGCPRVRLTTAALTQGKESKVETVHAVVLTQSCDLLVREGKKPKADIVLLCPFYTKKEVSGTSQFKDLKAWEECRRGQRPRFHVLNRCETEPFENEFLLVDLGAAFSLDYEVVVDTAQAVTSRPRLLPPYREHLSQAFARYYMRVGLPSDIPPFV